MPGFDRKWTKLAWTNLLQQKAMPLDVSNEFRKQLKGIRPKTNKQKISINWNNNNIDFKDINYI